MTWPDPEVVARLATDDEIPIGAQRVANAARAAGWLVSPTYARGTYPGRPPRVIDNLALRMRHGQYRTVAIWQNGKFHTALAWGPSYPLRRCSSQTLRAALREPHREGGS